ncbi:hypothetical protein D3C73_755620 [compost metagenome]
MNGVAPPIAVPLCSWIRPIACSVDHLSMRTIFPPPITGMMLAKIMPEMCEMGLATIWTSAGVARNSSAWTRPWTRKLLCEWTTHLGRPVVPEVCMSTKAASGST